jgi:ribosomal protein S18 acetylase RimI-like enzyme
MPGELIVPAQPGDVATVRALFEAYAASLGVSLGFQGFDAELAGLPGDYVPSRGGLWLARDARAALGCVALRPLVVHAPSAPGPSPKPAAGDRGPVAELKRLYVLPAARGLGLGRRLVGAAIDHARAAGYAAIQLDTLASMDAARELYRSLGFVPCPPYYDNPLDGVAWMALRL